MKKSKARGIAILGSTGSIGQQALEVIKTHPNDFTVELLTAGSNAELLIQQAMQFNPDTVIIADETKYQFVKEKLQHTDCKVYKGNQSVISCIESENIDMVIAAMVGYAGLDPVIAAIKARKAIALANKETLVVAGNYIKKLLQEFPVPFIPVDSEHSAIFQCLTGENHNPPEKIILTASGGPFRGKKSEDLIHVKAESALKHPNWNMGAKITIDSASLMNKGLEIIEAKWLFGLNPEQIEVVIHPQSIIHSLVQFQDGSIKAQMGLPDMKLPIQYAMSFPQRLQNNFPRFNFIQFPQLTFEQPDTKTFRNLELAIAAMKSDGNIPCILNAANEIVVAQFLKGNCGFLEMSDHIEWAMNHISYVPSPNMDIYRQTDHETRMRVLERF